MPEPVVAPVVTTSTTTQAPAPVVVTKPTVAPGRDAAAFQQILAQTQKLKTDRDAFTAEKTAFGARSQKVAELEAAIEKRDLGAAMKRMGYSDEEIANHIAEKGAGKDPELLAAKAELDALKKRMGDFETGAKTEAEKAKQSEQSKQAQAYQQELFQGVYAQIDKYPLIANYEQGPAVMAEMQRLHKTGVPLGPDLIAQAAASVETQLGEKIDPAYERLMGSEPIRKRMEAALAKKGFKIVSVGATSETKIPTKTAPVVITRQAAAPETKVAPPEKKRPFNADQHWRDIASRQPKV